MEIANGIANALKTAYRYEGHSPPFNLTLFISPDLNLNINMRKSRNTNYQLIRLFAFF